MRTLLSIIACAQFLHFFAVAEIVTIPAASENGFVIKDVAKRSDISLQYSAGKWKSWGRYATESPDSEKTERGDACRLVIALPGRNGKAGEILAIVPPNTRERAFVFKPNADYPSVVLRINDKDNSFSDNPGSVQYSLSVLKGAVAQPATAVPPAPVASARTPIPTAAVASATAPAPTPIPYAPAASLSVSAHEIGTGKGIERNWQTDYGSFNKDQYRTKGIEVQVRNLSRLTTGEMKVTACWTARELTGKRAIRIHHAETLPASATSVSTATVRFWSPLLPSNVTNYSALNERYAEGSKLDGWFVIVSRDDVIINGVGSSPTYQQLIKDQTQLQGLIAAYKPSGKSATAEMPHWRTDPVRTEWKSRSSTPAPTRYLNP